MNPETVSAWIAALGGRRYLMCMGASLVNSGLFAAQILSEAGYLTTFMATVGAYITASGIQKYTEGRQIAPAA